MTRAHRVQINQGFFFRHKLEQINIVKTVKKTYFQNLDGPAGHSSPYRLHWTGQQVTAHPTGSTADRRTSLYLVMACEASHRPDIRSWEQTGVNLGGIQSR